MTLHNALRYIDVLQTLVDTYNRTPHSGLGNNQTLSEVHALRNINLIKAQFKRMYLNKDARVKKR